MKTFTYAAAIALLSASAAFAQSSGNGATGSMQNMQNPPARSQSMSDQDMSGQATGKPSDIKGGMNMNQSTDRVAPQASRDMSRDMSKDDSSQAANDTSKRDMSKSVAHRKMASSDRSENARENETTMQLNRQQLASAPGGSDMSGMNGRDNSFDRGSPQQAQAGGSNCTPDRPDCGTARENPAINSSPQQRTYNAGSGVGQ